MSYKNNNDSLILLNDFIIEIINKHKYFTDTEYNSIKNINNKCKIDKDNDCQTNIKNKTDIQHYTFYFLLEYIKHITSCNNKNNI
jgi:hypothetical protein